MTKQGLIDQVAESADLSKSQAAEVIDCVVDSIGEALAGGDKVSLIGFGTFETRERAAREGRNPQTKAKIKIAAKTVPVFRPGKALRDKVG
ncbi:HU family DNA-binding protein [Candidatus Poribacteria bacterium]|jgi:DNA-binding protein HU-beta|nr:HU family DNA-binding protein [Candidatus Poribacteria bacterium]MBT5713249.1 HU family DNA-binding protein [Candidatus Poribacteria bacterium]MBT7805648.1 HU family DNA-binding protein [Candidatus Poribacteria bacterium]